MPFSRITQNPLRLLRSIITALRGAQNLAVLFCTVSVFALRAPCTEAARYSFLSNHCFCFL